MIAALPILLWTTMFFENPPGLSARPAEIETRLRAALAAMPSGYRPRTRYVEADGSARYVNRLIAEDSPYLLQHAHNPVDWYPWGEEAFAHARAEQKPIFLSIGYSTCHWCHVMEEESFDNEEIAAVLNRDFVCIKVDRERRPDVDDLYMTAVQLTGQRGGWPMSSFLTPDAKPFFNATYVPPEPFVDLLGQVRRAWQEQRAQIEADAERLADAVRQVSAATLEAGQLDDDLFARTEQAILDRYEPRFGGFSGAPKFPNEPELLFLLQRTARSRSPVVERALRHTLDGMARGGLSDQVGGGFHRYSVDERWLVPHFEKMLYNQAQLIRVYSWAWQLWGRAADARVAHEAVAAALRDLRAPDGSFYSATDADSYSDDGELEEGWFFVWTIEELQQHLGSDAALAIDLFGATEAGNFEGRNILTQSRPLEEVAAARELSLEELLTARERVRATLLEARSHRPPPLRDDKNLTAWNGMMVTALVEASEALAAPSYLEAAQRALETLWAAMWRGEEHGLWRVRLGEKVSIPGRLEDYAYLLEATLALFDATAEARWMERSELLAEQILSRFADREHGGFFTGAEDAEVQLLARAKSRHDGAIPAAGSVAVRALARLAERTGERRYRDQALGAIATLAASIEQHPTAFAYLLLGLDDLRHGEIGPRRYAAQGRVKLEAAWRESGEPGAVRLRLEIAPGWHVNANGDLPDELVATAVESSTPGWQLAAVTFPDSQLLDATFSDEPLRVFTGATVIDADLRPSGTSSAEGASADESVGLAIRLQACNDRLCLPPEQITLTLSSLFGVETR